MNTSLQHQNPFPGLRAFDYKEQHLFFGREKHIKELLNKLEEHHFVAVIGTSGSGKSSLIRAGLLPAIHQGKMGNSKNEWIIASMKPGNTPLQNLADALSANGVFGNGEEGDASIAKEIYHLISQSSLGLVQAVRNLLTGNRQLLLLVDQFEELFRFTDENSSKNNAESNAFAQLIIDSVRQKDIPIYVVLTLRSDFMGDCVRFEGLPEAINDGHYLVPRLNREQNKSAITGPIEYAQGKISPRLVQHVINDLGDNPDQLPVLQHALMRTWDKWTLLSEPGEPMDLRHYEMIGGMDQALSNHADEAYGELKNQTQQDIIKQVFKCLTVKTGDNRGVRRPTSVQNILQITGISLEELKETLHPFRKTGRTFILPGEEVLLTTATILDISHESLMRGWERLRTWVDEEMESADIYERVSAAALLYKGGRSALWRDPELQIAIDWKEKNKPNEAWSLQYNSHFTSAMQFLEDSKKERANELRKLNRRKSLVRAAVISFMIVVSSLTAWALLQTKKATEKSVLAEQKTSEAINQKQLAEKAKEMALEASRQAMDAKSFAELQSNIAGEQKKIAEQQKTKAEEEALRATAQEQEALRQKQIAEQKRLEALNQKQLADVAQTEAERLRLVSVSQNVAFKSLQEKNDAQLAALLAYKAYQLSKNNDGNMNDAQLYNALFSAAQKIDASYKPVVIRETENINALALSGNAISLFMQNTTIKNYSANNFKLNNQQNLNLPAAINTAYADDDGKYGAAGLENNAVAVFDLNNPLPKMLTGHEGFVRAVAFNKDASLIATGGRDSTLIIWKNNTLNKKVKTSSRVRAISFNADNSQLYVGGEDGKVVMINTDGSDVQSFSNGSGRVQVIKCNSKLTCIGYSSGLLQVFNNNGKILRSINAPAGVEFISLNENDDLLAVGLSNKYIQLYHISETSKPVEINCNSVITGLAMSNEFLYVSCADKTIRYYPIKTSWFENIFTTNIKRELTKEEWNTYIGADVTNKQ